MKSTKVSVDVKNAPQGFERAVQIFRSAEEPGIGITAQRIRVSKALFLFRQLVGGCDQGEELAGIRVCILFVLCKYIDLLWNKETSKKDIAGLLLHLEDVLTIGSWTIYAHPWLSFAGCMMEFSRIITRILSNEDEVAVQQELLQGLQAKLSRRATSTSDPLTIIIHIQISHIELQNIFHQAIHHFQAGRWAPALSLLKSKDSTFDVLISMEERLSRRKIALKRFALWGIGRDFEKGRAEMVRRKFEVQFAICKGSQLMHFGDIHFNEAMNGTPDDLAAKALLALDDYEEALRYVASHDIELEGAILFRLARFHTKVTKMALKAHVLYIRAIHLAESLGPILPEGEWYKECQTAVQKYRDDLQVNNGEQFTAKREPIVENQMPELDKLRAASDGMGDREFAHFVYGNWPPKTDGRKEPPPDSMAINKFYLKAIQRYHTDKNGKWGEEWLAMCEELIILTPELATY